MADISRITALDGVTYNLKDQQARLTMVGATDRTNGTPGAVTKPVAGDQNKLLQGDGTWTDTINIGRKANTTVGNNSVAEGLNTTASGDRAHAEGAYTIASGVSSHAEGSFSVAYDPSTQTTTYYQTEASGYCSHAEGLATTANHRSQHTFGEYNVPDPSSAGTHNRGNYIEIVGNGDSSAYSNARTLDWGGNEWLAGDLTVNGSSSGISVANRVLTPDTAIAIPSSSASYDLPGLTADHVVVAWRFSSSAENSPPCNLTVTTCDGYFTVVKSNGTTSETFQPVFAVPMAVTASTHQE